MEKKESALVRVKKGEARWGPFIYPVFRAIWIAALVSNVGTWMQNVGAVLLMNQLTSSPLLIALIQTATSLPIFLLSIPAGALADIFDRRHLLIFTQTWMFVMAAILGVLTLYGVTTPSVILFLTFLLGIGSALNGPAWQAIIPELVPRRQLASAISSNGASNNIARAVGPAVGGVVIAYFGIGFVFILNGVSFLGTLILIYLWKRRPVENTLPAERFLSALQAGVRYTRFSPILRAILVRCGAFTLAASSIWALLSPIVTAKLHLSPNYYGFLLSWLGAGAVAGAFVLPRIRKRLDPDKRMALSITIYSLSTLSLAFISNIPVLCFTMALGGMAWLNVMADFSVATQTNVPQWVQARVLSLYLLVTQGGLAIGSMIWGVMAEHFSLQVTMVTAAVATFAGLVIGLRYSLRNTGNNNFSLVHRAHEPAMAFTPEPEDGPVIIMVEYNIKEEDIPAFLKSINKLSKIRSRDGATHIGVYQDMAMPSRMVEYFIVDSWAEHLRQHDRFTHADINIRENVLKFHIGDTPPKTTHFIAAEAREKK